MNDKIVFEKGSGCSNALLETGWDLLAEKVSFPIAVIKESALRSNAKWMQDFSDSSSVKLAPHGKTTMAIDLFKLQLEQGCWGISLATVPQVINAVQHGIKRIILANQLVGHYHMELMAELLATNDLSFYCFVDSVENLHALGRYFSTANVRLNILIEVGVPNGRCGLRDMDKIEALISCTNEYPDLCLSGISFYEGVISGNNAENEIKAFVATIGVLVGRLKQDNKFDSQEVIVTGAGSAWYDIVATELVKQKSVQQEDYTVVIRPGCYLIHDTGIYQEAQASVLERSQLACDINGDLISSLMLWAYVHSVPEPGLAIIGLGKRDVAFDAGLPTPEYFYRPGTANPIKTSSAWQVVKIMDQHCMLTIDDEASILPGDLVCFSSSHPCLTMDKWRNIGIMDDNYVVNRTIKTYF